MKTIPTDKKLKEYIYKFLRTSNEISKKGKLDTNVMLAWNKLAASTTLNETTIILAWSLLQKGNKYITPSDALRMRIRNIEGKADWKLCKYFLPGWILYVPDSATTIMRLVEHYQDFLLVSPFPFDNDRIGRMICLWIILKNNLEHYLFTPQDDDEREENEDL